MEPHCIEEEEQEEEILQQQDCKQNEPDMHIVTDYHLFIHNYMYFTVATPTSPVQLAADVTLQTTYQTKSKHQLLAEVDTVRQMYQDKDKQQILRLKEELQAKQGGLTSPSDQFEQREKEMLEQKGTQNQLEYTS